MIELEHSHRYNSDDGLYQAEASAGLLFSF
jgi:hypothetical protein